MSAHENQRKRLWEESAGHCIYCGHAVTPQSMAVDHIIPLSKGGENSFANKVCCCPACNAQKANKDLMDFLLELPPSKHVKYVNRLDTLQQQGKMAGEKVQRLLGVPQEPEEFQESEWDFLPHGWNPQVLCNVYVSIIN